MDIINGIKTRRSIRSFKDEAISKETIAQIVDTAAFAPSWKNSQTTRYTAIFNKDIKERLANDCMQGFTYNTNTVNGAPCVVVVSTVNGRSGYERDGSPTTSKGTHWQSFDAGIATQTFCLAAHEAGLGTVIMGIFDEAKVAELLSLPEGQSVSALIAIGYPNDTPDAPKRKTSAELLSSK
ncbi:MAG: nitroreductase family protein [Ruminococcaceae bacterium]|nr:nitroreductase family protein [Oscillospiraceae bacterium]